MTHPIRLQRRRTKGFRLESPNGLPVVYVGRPTVWSNPFKIGEHWQHGAARAGTCNQTFIEQLLAAFGDRKLTREDCVAAYRIYLDYAGLPQTRDGHWPEPSDLWGCNLSCWCSLDEPCHADELLRRAAL